MHAFQLSICILMHLIFVDKSIEKKNIFQYFLCLFAQRSIGHVFQIDEMNVIYALAMLPTYYLTAIAPERA